MSFFTEFENCETIHNFGFGIADLWNRSALSLFNKNDRIPKIPDPKSQI
jgi:hypothetical protein